ncbi:hypothetical protein WN55_01124 [Dufourea novaeangliae]|uniref:Uncharacterized protein n=1 Tax=Dufourea novaeangliae TaxID=178035 RepID=A0A154PE79_DUFNO|nr:hypothetical protein WN55_01124 [Dufourea novaeangliae]
MSFSSVFHFNDLEIVKRNQINLVNRLDKSADSNDRSMNHTSNSKFSFASYSR